MTDKTRKPGKRPDYTAYYVPEREGCPWIAIGAAWDQSDGQGFTVKLDLIPVSTGKVPTIMLRRIKPSATVTGEGAQ